MTMGRVLARSTIHLGGWDPRLGAVGLTDDDDPRIGHGLEVVREGDFTREELNQIAEELSIPAGELSSKGDVIAHVEKAVKKRDAETL